MDIALVTGADTALGLALVERLLRQGFRVHGLGNNFSSVTLSHPEFQAHALDLTDVPALQQCVEAILEKEGAIHQVIYAIDVSPGTPFHQQTPGGVEGVLRIGLIGPVMLTRLVLPNLVRFRGGLVFILASGKPGFHINATNGLIEGGLRRFASELLSTHRDAGLKVTTVLLQHNEALPAPGADPQLAKQTRVELLDVADLVERVVAEGAPNLVGEITIYPRTSPAAERLPASALAIDPYREVRLPPKDKRPEEKTPIPTEKPARPQQAFNISDEELEDRIAEAMEEYANHPEHFDGTAEASDGRGPRQKRGNRNRKRDERETQNNDERSENAASSGGDADSSDGEHRKKRKRNRNRNRNRKRGPKQGNEAPAEAASSPDKSEKTKTETAAKPAKTPDREIPAEPSKPSEAKPAGETDQPAKPKPAKKKTARTVKKVAKKRVTKKAAKKATAAKEFASDRAELPSSES